VDYKARWGLHLVEEDDRAPSTVKQYRWRIDTAEKISGKSMLELSEDDLRELKRHLKQLGWAPETVKSIVVAVRQWRKWAELVGLVPRGNHDLVKTPRTISSEARPLTRDQVRTLMAACQRPLEYRVIYYPAFAGTRIGEAAIIDGTHWHDDGVLRFPGEKNRRWREVPIHPDLQRVKWKILAHPPTYDSTLQRVKRRLEKRTGIDFVVHQLRKTFATTLDECGGEDRVIKELLGHAHDTTGIYIKVSLRRKRETMAPLSYDPPEVAATG
jgi:integrase